jgi:GNAT superfamily N-acetyltransferase
MGVEFHQIVNTEEDYFLQAIQIYEEAFPANEKQSLDLIKNRIIERKSKLVVGIINSEVVCMSLLWEFDSLDFVLLDYMAVSKNHRNNNLGTQLFQYLSNIIRGINKYMIIEVENHLFGNNSIERKRRINFYIQNGAYVLDNVNYILPSLDGTSPTEMLLMISPKYKSNYINSELVKDLISRLYIELYKRNENDLVLIKILKQLPNKIILKSKQLL